MTQLRVIKQDRNVEAYLHTKVLGTVNDALTLTGNADVFVAEQFAEAVTFYLYQKPSNVITSDEIHQLVRLVLSSTGYEEAAQYLDEHRMGRIVKRRRIEVVDGDAAEDSMGMSTVSRWDKSRIVQDLVDREGLDRPIARAIASVVEKKVFNLGTMRIRQSLIHQIVLAETEAMLQAQRQLQAV